MSKLLILQGVPASGKSTFARGLDSRTWIRVNRDDIRRMMGTYMVNPRERIITEVECNMVRTSLGEGWNVCVDDTNLNPKTVAMWEDIAARCECELEYKRFEISMGEALERDAQREFPVGKRVIENFFRKYYPSEYERYYTDFRLRTSYNEPMDDTLPDVVLCDLDGTIALHNGRNAFEYNKINTDVVNRKLERLLAHLDIPVIFLSGREGTQVARQQTQEWLDANGFGNCPLYMRAERDYRPDEIIKAEIYDEHIRGKFNVVAIFDDRNKVVNMWREHGQLCCQVNDGDF